MGIFARIKKFFKRLKAAIKELIFGEPQSNEIVDVEVVTETTTDSDGNIIITKTERVNPNGTWKDIFRKAGNKIKSGVNYAIDNPGEVWKKIFGPGAAIATVCMVVNSCTRTWGNLTSPFKKIKENRDKKLKIYDDTIHEWYSLNRPLSRAEKNAVLAAQAKRGDMHDALEALGVLA